MSSVDFEIDEPGVLRVRTEASRFKPVPVPDGITDLAFRNAVAIAYTLFVQSGSLPSVKDMHETWPKLSEQTLGQIVATDEFAKALQYRGVDWKAENGLTLEQQLALMKLTDPTDRRSTGAKLKEMGVPYPRYQAWMRQPLFPRLLSNAMENQLKDAVPIAINKLIGNMEAGDQRAIEKTLEISGRYNPAMQSVEDAKLVVQRVIEAVIRRVADPDTRMAILADIQSEAVSYAVTSPKSLEGSRSWES